MKEIVQAENYFFLKWRVPWIPPRIGMLGVFVAGVPWGPSSLKQNS